GVQTCALPIYLFPISLKTETQKNNCLPEADTCFSRRRITGPHRKHSAQSYFSIAILIWKKLITYPGLWPESTRPAKSRELHSPNWLTGTTRWNMQDSSLSTPCPEPSKIIMKPSWTSSKTEVQMPRR